MYDKSDVLLEWLELSSRGTVGKGIHLYNEVSDGIISTRNKSKSEFSLLVPSQTGNRSGYDVTIRLGRGIAVYDYCECKAFERSGECKHVVAGVLHLLIDEFEVPPFEIEMIFGYAYEIIPPNVRGWEGDITIKSEVIIPSSASNTVSESSWHSFQSSVAKVFNNLFHLTGFDHSYNRILNKTSVISAEMEPMPHWKFRVDESKKNIFLPEIKFDRNDTFYYRCDCSEPKQVCSHVRSSFELLKIGYGSACFHDLKDWDSEKKALLSRIGLNISDPEASLIEFDFDYHGNLTMKEPEWLWKAHTDEQIRKFKKVLSPELKHVIERPKLSESSIMDFEVGFLLNLTSQHFQLGFELQLLKVQQKKNTHTCKKLIIHDEKNLAFLSGLPEELYETVVALTEDRVKAYLIEMGHGYLRNNANPWSTMTEKSLEELHRYYVKHMFRIWDHLRNQEHIYVLKEGRFSNQSISRIKLGEGFVNIFFKVVEDERFITISLQKEINNVIVDTPSQKIYYNIFFEADGLFYLPARPEDIEIIKQFKHGFVKIPVADKRRVIKSVIPAIQQNYPVTIPASMNVTTIETDPVPQVLLTEMDNKFLLLRPQFKYDDIEVNYHSDPEEILQELHDGSLQLTKRSPAKERLFFEKLRLLHPSFAKQSQNDFLFLPFDEAMKQNWFVISVRQLQEANIPVLGMMELKKFRYNTSKPKWEMKAGSGIDWFDLKIEVSFGDQTVSLRDVRKAVLNWQSVVVLGDGTFGILPEEWLQQYGLLLKMGDEQKDGSLRVSKLHYTLIDELHGQIDDEQILQEINEKKQRLQNIDNIQLIKPSKKIKAKLRPYQLSGFQWMQTLDELGWGGCLADDMGLGKTLQTITFLQYLKEKYKGCTNLVVCPTSLIYNWENELAKFAPALKYHIYYGIEREFDNEHFEDYDIVITSYGIVRNDLEHLIQFQWRYVILDESQAIKNPDAQTTKAIQLLKATNKLILSGTPVQNNTFDLFSQMQFINPGLLGSKEFYKTEFANAIDKYNDAEKSNQLRRLVYPFMLRRTKEQVAPDLPDKTETILWCEMAKEQRAVYEEYKNYYRAALMKKIEEVGMAKAGMYVLEGLLRLRQICDSPQLIKDNETTTQESVKIEELLREIEENTGSHKILVFSQFTEMLGLIERKLQQHNICYSYLDGSIAADRRKKAVNDFQNDPEVRVFLISLKAGGVGLNLTAADYVYLVDPWWNPAVEQQAIDRTHRIGQKNKIFAYKMICKDTVEEKILQLQQKKKQLANDLVTEDAGFIKKLSKDDIAFLFS